MEVHVAINSRIVATMYLKRTGPMTPVEPVPGHPSGGATEWMDSTPGVGVGDYDVTLYADGEVKGRWQVSGHDRSTGIWGLVADALAALPEMTESREPAR